MGFGNGHLPIGLQIIGNRFDEVTMYKLASFVEEKLGLELDPREVK
jgi:Asp-tRNA(Asn)/Glu-tRNA(Gln) amidotransferase A subunit family amidase